MDEQSTTLDNGERVTKAPKAPGGADGLTAAGGLIAALGSISCCILPLLLFSIGASGSWMANLTALAPYQGYFIAAAVGLIGLGFWRLYRPAARSCAPGAACGSPRSRRIAKAGLWVSVLLVAAAVAFNWLAPLLLPE